MWISYLNAHTSNLAATDSLYQKILQGCDLVYADGQAVVWAARVMGMAMPERVNAGDFIIDFCRALAQKNLRIFLIGGQSNIAQLAGANWQEKVPALQIAGTRDGYFSEQDSSQVIEEIRQAKPDVLLIGMGAPRQERFMQTCTNAGLDTPVIWCVGALFEYFTPQRKRAPRWVCRIGLEWLFRLVQEPRRLTYRYLIGNPRFIARVLRAKFAKK